MISNRVVFVLGAGASVPYGLPTAQELGRHVVGDTNVATLVANAGFRDEDFRSMCADLISSGEPSIDGFLETRDDYLEIGKIAIAAALLPRERTGGGSPAADDWYQDFLSWVRAPTIEDYAENNIAVITFNYDRSLEFRIAQSILGRFGQKARSALRRCIDLLQIVHVHGTLGLLPELSGDGGGGCVPYGASSPTPELLRNAARGIQIPTRIESVEGYARSASVLGSADIVFFLGFGYHAQLLSRIGTEKIRPGTPVFGTTIGLRPIPLARTSSLLAKSGAAVDLDQAATPRTIRSYLHAHEDRIATNFEGRDTGAASRDPG